MHFVRDFDLKLGSEINMKSFIYVCGVAKPAKGGVALGLVCVRGQEPGLFGSTAPQSTPLPAATSTQGA